MMNDMSTHDIAKNHYTRCITPLEREEWQDYKLPFHYISHNYYDVEINRSCDGFEVSFVKDLLIRLMSTSRTILINYSNLGGIILRHGAL